MLRRLALGLAAILAVLAIPTAAGAATSHANGNWGLVQRNIIGSGFASIQTGPAGVRFGTGSLYLSTPSSSDAVAYGNEVDFVGTPIANLNQVGFYVYTTGENIAAGGGSPNMPSINFEIDPNGAGGTTTHYASLVFMPDNSPANQWSPYIDATTTGHWGLTGSQFNSPATQDNCGINGPRCTFDQVKAFLATGSGATMLTAQITKGRDFAFHGAVDGLTINGTTYDFDPAAAPAPIVQQIPGQTIVQVVPRNPSLGGQSVPAGKCVSNRSLLLHRPKGARSSTVTYINGFGHKRTVHVGRKGTRISFAGRKVAPGTKTTIRITDRFKSKARTRTLHRTLCG